MRMTVDDYVEDIVLQLGDPFVEVETKELLSKIVDMAFKELKRYITEPTYDTVTYTYPGRIDLSEYNVLNIHYVMRAQSENGMYNLFSDAYLSGNIRYPSSTLDASDFRALIELTQLKNTISTDLDWNWVSPYLYIATNLPRPSALTIVYTKDYAHVTDIVDPFWQDLLRRLSLALAKVQLGRVRSKYTLNNATYNLDGSSLVEEGTSELNAVREELRNASDFLIPLD